MPDVDDAMISVDTSVSTVDHEGMSAVPVPLSISWKDAEMSQELYEGKWTKASTLVAQSNSHITRLACSKLVCSTSNPKSLI